MPTRYLKAEICDSETLDRLSPLSEVLFYRLLVTVDDFGRLDARDAFVKSKCFPVRESLTVKDVGKLLIELANKSVITLYEVDGRRYLQMSKWTNKPRADVSKYPAMRNQCMQMYTDEKQCKANPPETETETETETEDIVSSIAVDACPHEKIIELYHSVLPTMPSIKIWTEKRRKLLQARWREDKKRQTIDYWERLFAYVAESDFLCGRTAKPFNCDLEWMLNSSNFVKIIEGKYHAGS